MPPATTKKQQLLTVDLKSLKPLVLAAARSANQRPSAWCRDVIARALNAASPKPSAAPSANHTNHDSPKLTLRLDRAEHEQLGALALAEGMTRSQWLRHRLRQPNAPVIPLEHVDTLVKSTYQLAGLGRNLNQIARSLNAYPGRTTAADRQGIAEAAATVREHLAVAASAIALLPQPARVRKSSK